MIVVWTVRRPDSSAEAYLLGWNRARGSTWHRESRLDLADAPGLWLPDYERLNGVYVPWALWDILSHPPRDPDTFCGWMFYWNGGYSVHYRRYEQTSSGVERIDEVEHVSPARIEHDAAAAGELHPTVADVWSRKH